MSTHESQQPAKSMRPRVVAYVSVLVLAGLLICAALWPIEPCSHPSCVRQRFTLALEIDALEQVEPIALEVETPEGPQSLTSIMSSGGIAVSPWYDDLNVPYNPASGPLDRADLYQFVSAWRSRTARRQADARIYALLTAGLISDSGESLFGIMFDLAGREAFAVAPRTTQRYFQALEPQSIELLQLRTFVHELLHAMNRDHADAAVLQDGRLTLEAPTRCIAVARSRQWSLLEQPLMALSPATIRFFQSAPSREVLPGYGNSPYARRRTSASECERARANVAAGGPERGWQRMLRQLQSMLAIPTVHAAETQPLDERTLDAHIALQAQPAAYPLGYPIAVRVVVRNTGDEPLPLGGRLDPAYGFVTLEYRRAGRKAWRVFQPLTWFEPIGSMEALLAPGERTEQTVPIYFGEDGWTFSSPGEYELRARLTLGEPTHVATSAVTTVRVAEPNTQSDTAALEPLLDERGELEPTIGRLLSFGGRIGGAADMTPLESVAALYRDTALGGALRLTLLSHRLRPPIDPRTGERPPPDLKDARALLKDTCTDSGVAAMAAEVLAQHDRAMRRENGLGGDEAAPGASGGAQVGAAAWDGVTSSGRSIPTYSDPSLRRWGPSLHFCFNDARLRPEVRGAVTALARRLAEARPERIVLVGHGDHTGTCRINDAIALQRARAVRDALVAGGIERGRIDIVSLGERRPQDFSASEAAHAANRRVEILVEGREDDSEDPRYEAEERILPRCS